MHFKLFYSSVKNLNWWNWPQAPGQWSPRQVQDWLTFEHKLLLRKKTIFITTMVSSDFHERICKLQAGVNPGKYLGEEAEPCNWGRDWPKPLNEVALSYQADGFFCQQITLTYNDMQASQAVKWERIHPPMQKMWVWSLGPKEPLEKEITTQSSILAWEIPWIEEPEGL